MTGRGAPRRGACYCLLRGAGRLEEREGGGRRGTQRAAAGGRTGECGEGRCGSPGVEWRPLPLVHGVSLQSRTRQQGRAGTADVTPVAGATKFASVLCRRI